MSGVRKPLARPGIPTFVSGLWECPRILGQGSLRNRGPWGLEKQFAINWYESILLVKTTRIITAEATEYHLPPKPLAGATWAPPVS